MSNPKTTIPEPGDWVRIQRYGRLEIAEVFHVYKGTDGKRVVVTHNHGSFHPERILEIRKPVPGDSDED